MHGIHGFFLAVLLGPSHAIPKGKFLHEFFDVKARLEVSMEIYSSLLFFPKNSQPNMFESQNLVKL